MRRRPIGQDEWTPARLRALRASRGWSQQALAEALGVHAGTVAHWEQGLSTPSRMARRALAALTSGAANHEVKA